MKLRHKILAAVVCVLKPVLVPVMNWYAKRKIRKEMQKLSAQQNYWHESITKEKGEDLTEIFNSKSQGDIE